MIQWVDDVIHQRPPLQANRIRRLLAGQSRLRRLWRRSKTRIRSQGQNEGKYRGQTKRPCSSVVWDSATRRSLHALATRKTPAFLTLCACSQRTPPTLILLTKMLSSTMHDIVVVQTTLGAKAKTGGRDQTRPRRPGVSDAPTGASLSLSASRTVTRARSSAERGAAPGVVGASSQGWTARGGSRPFW